MGREGIARSQSNSFLSGVTLEEYGCRSEKKEKKLVLVNFVSV